MPQTTLNIPRETTHQRIADALEDIVDKLVDTSDADNVNYDNTTSGLSANKVQGAIDELSTEKVDKISGKGLSTNDYTTAEKTKLAGIEEYANKTVVDSAMSDTSTNPLQNKVITKELERPKTVQGSLITINDAAPVNAVDLSVDINPIQDLHGYNNPWVGGAGKNLLPMTVDGIKAANTSGTWSGNVYSLNSVTFEILVDSDDNVTGIKANGTANPQAIFNFQNTYIQNEFKGMKLNGCAENSNGINVIIQYSNNGESWVNEARQKNGQDLVISSEYNYCMIGLIVGVNYSASNVTFYPMIRLATESDSTFAPYTNICPISGRSEVNVERIGVNWYAGSPSFDGYTNENLWSIESEKYNNHEVRSRLGGWNGLYKTFTLETGTYTFSCMAKASENCECQLFITEVSGQQVRNIVNVSTTWNKYSCTFTLSERTPVTPKFECRVNGVKVCISEYQLELNSTATSYQHYQGKTYTIHLGQEVYGGTLDVTSGELVVDMKEIDLGTLNWAKYLDSYPSVYIIPSPLSDAKKFTNTQIAKIISSQYIPTTIDLIGESGYAHGFIAIGRSKKLNVSDNRFNSLQEFQMAMNGVQLVYELATPFTIQLTPQQIKLLQGTNTVYSDSGDIYIEYQPDNAIGEAVRIVENENDTELEYKTDLSNIAPIENNDTASTSYTIGSYLCHNGKLYKVISAIASGETFASSNIQQTTIMAEIMSRL